MTHGRHWTYIKHKCRCPECRESHRVAQAKYRATPAESMCVNCGRWYPALGIGRHEQACMNSAGCAHGPRLKVA